MLICAVGIVVIKARKFQVSSQWASRVQGIESALLLYAQNHDGRSAAELGELYLEKYLTAEYLLHLVKPFQCRSLPGLLRSSLLG